MAYKLQKSYRLHNFDYSQLGIYFITICTKDRIGYFGRINQGKIELSEIGKIADYFWQEIPKHFDNICLDEYIIMPNHIHGIIEIRNNNNNDSCRNVALLRSTRNNHHTQQSTQNVAVQRSIQISNHTKPHTQDTISENSTQNVAVQRSYNCKKEYFSNLSPKKDSLSVIMRSFKSICAKMINKQFPKLNFQWQPRFHDRVIRNEKELNNIRRYIYYNPVNWEQDRNNLEGLLI